MCVKFKTFYELNAYQIWRFKMAFATVITSQNSQDNTPNDYLEYN